MSSQEKRMKRTWGPPPTPQSSPIPSLPYDMVLICVARVSRLYYPTLSLVSKSFRSLISSPELYKTRSLLGFKESCLYVCLETLCGNSTWFTLCRKPDNKTYKKAGSTGYALAKILIPNSLPGRFRSLVGVGSNVYDTETDSVSSEEDVSKVGKWDMVGERIGERVFSDAYCMIGNVLYGASDGDSDVVFKWYDNEMGTWRDLQSLVGLPKIPSNKWEIFRLADYGGKMVVFWGEINWPCKIWCAEIALERRRQGKTIDEIWGNVEWFDQVLEIEECHQVEKVLSTTL